MLLYTAIGSPVKLATWITRGARCCCRAKDSWSKGKPELIALLISDGISMESKNLTKSCKIAPELSLFQYATSANKFLKRADPKADEPLPDES